MIDLKFFFSSLFSLRITHEFFADKKLGGIKYVLTPESNDLIRKCGLSIKMDDESVNALIDGDKRERLLYFLKNNTEDLVFNFLIYPNNQYFINFTDLPSENQGNILFFSNRSVSLDNEENNLHKTDFVTGGDIFPSMPASFLYSLKSRGAELILSDEKGDVLINEKADEKYQIDLSAFKPGKYTIKENGKAVLIFIYTGEDKALRPLAMVSITLNGLVNKIIENLEDGQVVPSYKYKVSFKERSTYWKYFIVPKYTGSLKEALIDTGEDEIKFSGPQEVKMSNGETAFLFVSEVALPLKESVDYRFQLKNNRGNGAGRTLMNRLPVPSFETIKPESRDVNSKVFSEVIVYI